MRKIAFGKSEDGRDEKYRLSRASGQQNRQLWNFWRFCLALIALVATSAFGQNQQTIKIAGFEKISPDGTPDVGSITINVMGQQATVSYGRWSTTASVAAGLAARFSSDCGSFFYAVASGDTVTIKARDGGWPEDVNVVASSTWNGSFFTTASFAVETIGKLTPSIVATCSPQTIAAGDQTNCKVELPAGATGTITFNFDTGPTYVVTLGSNGIAQAPAMQFNTIGDHGVNVSYSGDAAYNAGTEAASIFVTTIGNTALYTYNIIQDDGQSGFDPAGNIIAYTDNVNGKWSFSYDGLDRLVGGSVSSTSYNSNLCWSYDSSGNRLEEAVTSFASQSATTGSCSAAGVLSDKSVSYNVSNNRIIGDPLVQYDAAGNVISDADNSYLYDAENRICAVGHRLTSGGTELIQYIYDADGRRIAKGTFTTWASGCDTSTNGFQPTALFGLGPDGEQTTELSWSNGAMAWTHTNVSVGKELTATYTATGTHFHLSDWLGSRRVQVDALGRVEKNCSNFAFGNALNCTSPAGAPSAAADVTEHHFTGKERDSESGLDYFGARYYGSSMGRFMSPDWASHPQAVPYASLSNPQSLNLYAYVNNNPLSQVDEDGHFASPWHFLITFVAAIATGHDPIHAAIWGVKNALVDRGTQGTSPAMANIHGMGGTGQDTQAAYQGTVETLRAERAAGDIPAEQHTLQDPRSESHNYSYWGNGYGGFWGYLKHQVGDWIPMPWKLGEAIINSAKDLNNRDPNADPSQFLPKPPGGTPTPSPGPPGGGLGPGGQPHCMGCAPPPDYTPPVPQPMPDPDMPDPDSFIGWQ